ncbi:putative oleosin [Helianthus annuus]|uniref:Oleosin n=1 Tax=Helianthus annuus TaxID=4232 RepID=A0A251UPB8_HELAN|nr:oleosin 1 [Helianthus annuus]KAF5805592.1 putative oleosin [Helianthus annuus]KAJ0570001.1 putative oleosin [Helianthus annuus]KAJ0576702.1 putative oleosin [Helianthus annuus]KAJ0584330.1 putative oleosin [Helianthus annuus]KAJ0746962.1 putative oleosin [Helianthus annuus]
MTDIHQTYNPQHHSLGGATHQQHVSPRVHQAVKAATAATAGGSLLVLSGLILAGTVIALTIATPLLVIFSPVLVPAVITVFLIVTGFLTSGGFGVAAVTVLSWIYRYATGGHPPGADSLDQARDKLGYKAREMKGRAEHATGMGQHHITGGGLRADM